MPADFRRAVIIAAALGLLACGEDPASDREAGIIDTADGDTGSRDTGSMDTGTPPGAVLEAAAAPRFFDDALQALPGRLSEIGLFPGAPDMAPTDRVLSYLPLWSNGLSKQRHVFLPSPVDNASGPEWELPVATVLFKTFSEPVTGRPIETRVIRKQVDGRQFAVYAWEPDASDAQLVTSPTGVPVEVSVGGQIVPHEIPSALACRACHESSPGTVLGFNELQLALQLGDLSAAFVETPPANPEEIVNSDALTRDVLGYLQGNCVSCHNGSEPRGPNTTFDLRHTVAEGNLIGRATESSGVEPGIRVVPGDPDSSVLISAFERTTGDPMPPFGVQLRDEAGLERLRTWIAQLQP